MHTNRLFSITLALLVLVGLTATQTANGQDQPDRQRIDGFNPFTSQSITAQSASTLSTEPERTLLREGSFQNAVGSAHAINGKWIAVGAGNQSPSGTSNRTGMVFIYERLPDGTTTLKQELAPGNLELSRGFGNSLRFHGNTLIVGASGDRNEAIYVFELDDNDTWTLSQRIDKPNENSFSQFGGFLDTDGNYLIAGTLNDGVYLYIRNSGTWDFLTRVEVPGVDATLAPYPAILDHQTFAVLTETDVHILRISGTEFTESQRIAIPAPEITNIRNVRIASSGAAFALSNLNDSGTFASTGAVYLFDRMPNQTWAPMDTLRAPDTVENTTFGTSLHLSGDRLLIGNYGENKAHLYRRETNRTWSHLTDIHGEMSSLKRLTNNQPAVAMQNNILLSGITSSLDGESYLFEIDTDFEPLAYFNGALSGDPVWFPTFTWFRSLPFNTVGMSFAMSGRNQQGVPQTRLVTAPNADRPNQFTDDSQLIADLYAPQGGLHWVRPDRNAGPYFFISGYPEDLADPNRAAFFDVGSTVTEIPSNLPDIGGTAAWSDLDGDGLLDVVLSGLEGSYFDNNRATRILLNQGDMQFEPVDLPEIASRNANAVLIFDFFNRGLKDILLVGLQASGGGTENLLIRNLGNGAFEADPDSPLSVVSSSTLMETVAMGDLDNDGHMDLVIGGWSGTAESPIGIWWNNGDGTFSRTFFRSTLISGSFGLHIEIADINNDGLQDILYSADNDFTRTSTSYLFENQGERSFSISTPDLPAMRRGGITAGDITLDGQPELVAFGSDNKNNPVLTAYRNGLPQQLYTRPDALENLQVALNEQGNLVASWDPGTDAITPSEALTYNVRISTSDLEEDLDNITESMSFTSGVLRTKGPGNAGFLTQFALPPLETGQEVVISVSAVNHHGFASPFTSTSWNAASRFATVQDLIAPIASGAFHPNWVDVDRDGNLDLAFRPLFGGTPAAGVSIFELSDGQFVEQPDMVPGSRAEWGDFNNDGWPDAAYVNGDYLAVGLNNQDGSFSTDTENGISMRVNDLAVTDYNNNGEMGIIVASGSFTDDDSTRVVRHIGNGALELTDIVLPPALSAEAGDFNNDGCADLLLQVLDEETSTDQLTVYAGDCTGAFTESVVLLDEGFIHHALWGDLTANGYPDVVAVVSPDTEIASAVHNIHIFPNQGDGTFGDAVVYEGFSAVRPVLADISGNGYADLLINGGTESLQDPASALLNAGDGSLEFTAVTGIGAYPGGMMAAADVFGSGRADVFAGGRVSDSNGAENVASFYRNFSASPYEAAGAPVGLSVDPDQFVTLSWDGGEAGTTPASGVTYNLRVGTEPGGNDVISALALDTGKRLVARPGNVGGATSVVLRDLQPNTTYYWSVQAIDNLHNGSAFAEEQTFVSGPVSLDGGMELPAQVELSQNYPNPFNPSTSIRFGLPESDQVRISVYDVTGRLVSEVADTRFQAGYHVVRFDGSRLASGVYLYRLQTGNTVLTRKMSLVK
ncbi:MAG: extracellular VBS repeat domain protein [Bacteroidetes bacterium HLUCCA01]|nr:MAG: extracellular VBS repeat domain protein [Bacteroidetes bacterium HLUCCA01]